MLDLLAPLKGKVASTTVAAVLFGAASVLPATAKVFECGGGGTQTLKQSDGGQDVDLKVIGTCLVTDTASPGKALQYIFHNVNVINSGLLNFVDGNDIDFYAESILIENFGSLVAGSASSTGAFKSRLTFHLWGKPTDDGIECQSAPQPKGAPCGIPDKLWVANPGMANHMNMDVKTPPDHPKNKACTSITGYSNLLPGDDCFYQYEVQDAQDRQNNKKAYFSHKVLAVSFGGTLKLFGSDGTIYLNGPCKSFSVGNECNPANTGTSWRRLVTVSPDNKTLTLNTTGNPVRWKKDDHIVVTTTDYLPSHSEERILASDVVNNQVVLTEALTYPHNASLYPIPTDVPSNIGPQLDPNIPEVNRAVDTRAAVALLSRNIQIVSAGDTPSDPFTETPGNYYGGHTIVRQGFAAYQVQGVEFYLLGQGGMKSRYPVHFHMARRTPQQTDQTKGALNYLKDCSIHESMTRWVTIHATQGMYVARNVGFRSIGHGFYFEDATETNNRLYANIGIMARAAIQNGQNPRQVPGILADTSTDGGEGDSMPYRSDFNHPTVFWIMNGWNDFQYNMAAGAATCGACYWWLPSANSGPSQYEWWDGYASQQIWDPQGNTDNGNIASAGLTPMKTFYGNSCVAAMSSFQTVGNTAACLGVPAKGSGGLAAVPSSAPKAPTDPNLFSLYYPTMTDLRNPTTCAGADDPSKSVQCGNTLGVNAPTCDSRGNNCAATVLDHYTTSFNWAQTNFSAVWLRPRWFLVRNSAITDVQTGGINFVTGGGYTRSDVPQGYWSVLRKSVLVGHTQSQGDDGNPFASDAGPFNPETAKLYDVQCDTSQSDRCQSATEGVTFLLPPFPGQRLFNIYDGPAFQEFNAYLDVNTTHITDCTKNPTGRCDNSQYPLTRNLGVLNEKTTNECYLPNAAIAWKQPNGFYYPPSFHSKKLWFENVDIRHFVVEPFFTTDPADPYNPFIQSQSRTMDRYCTYAGADGSGHGHTFDGFNHIDRETVLNDDDGSLTGLLAKDSTEPMPTRPTISINEDDYFNGPLITPECLSDRGVKPLNPDGRVYTARTSPYEWLSTAITADCGIQDGKKSGNLEQCQDSQNRVQWAHDCTNPSCRGVQLFREDLTDKEKGTQPEIRMMGQDAGQRSTLSLNRGAYYIDTTQNCTSQGACPVCTPNNQGTDCKFCKPGTTDCWDNAADNDPNPWHPTVFLGGHTYYVFFIYAKPSTKQTYDIYVGPNQDGKFTITPIRANLPSKAYEFKPVSGGTWISSAYKDKTGTVRVTVDLTNEKTVFDNSKASFCQPRSFCAVKGSGATATCGCKAGTLCTDDAVCAWATADLDCPLDPDDPTKMGCYGFSFKMPDDFQAPPAPIPPASSLFQLFTANSYFQKGVVTFDNQVVSSGADCKYSAPPTQ